MCVGGQQTHSQIHTPSTVTAVNRDNTYIGRKTHTYEPYIDDRGGDIDKF
jgi:hypothetical protein